MARPVFKKPVAKEETQKPTGLPKPRVKPKAENPKLDEAKSAVQEFEVQHRMLQEMKNDWNDNFPEAKLALEDIQRQEDSVSDSIKQAKPLVAACKETVGDFKAQRKYSKPHYDPAEVTRIISELENGLEVFGEMLENGIVKVVDLDKEAALAWFAQRPGYSDAFQPAFKPEAEMTTAVSTPKI